ncbi:MAG: superoxide dismutase [Bacteroidota bacterium]
MEPMIDAKTMEIHHSKHHAAYVAKLNAEASKWDKFPTPEELCKKISGYNTAVRNNAGGHYNHSFFWKIMCPPGHAEVSGKLSDAISKKYGSMKDFKAEFKKSAAAVFGSGWAWLVVTKNGDLEIGTTSNQDNPLMDVSAFKGTPVIGLDVWEHAYYLKHQNLRADYIEDFWNVVNWQQAETNYLTAMK